MQTGQVKHLQQPMVDEGGNSQWLDIIKTPILDSKGRITGTAGISRDITAHKETEAELRKLRDNLRSLTMEVAWRRKRREGASLWSCMIILVRIWLIAGLSLVS